MKFASIYICQLILKLYSLIFLFQSIAEIEKIKEHFNPATWMLEASSVSTEVRLGMDFAEYYKTSSLYQ